jgi:hypothetical protein
MRGWLIGLVAVACGIAGWEIMQFLHPGREPWDLSEYWKAVYPGMMAVAALLGYHAPDRPWRWGLAIVMGQGLWMLLRTSLKSGFPNLWPMSLVLLAVLSLPCIGAAYFGAYLGRLKAD